MRRVLKVGLIRLWGVVEGVARGNKVEDFFGKRKASAFAFVGKRRRIREIGRV